MLVPEVKPLSVLTAQATENKNVFLAINLTTTTPKVTVAMSKSAVVTEVLLLQVWLAQVTNLNFVLRANPATICTITGADDENVFAPMVWLMSKLPVHFLAPKVVNRAKMVSSCSTENA